MARIPHRKREGDRWLIRARDGRYLLFEDMGEADRQNAYAYFSGEELREECDYLTEHANYRAKVGLYAQARKLSIVSDELEIYLKNGGDKHR